MALQFQPYANPFAKQQMEQEQYNQLNQTLGGLSNQFAQGAQANSQEKYRQAELARQLELMDMERKKFGWQEAEQNRLNTVTPMEDPVDIFKSSYSLTQKNPNAKQQSNPFQNPQMGMQQPAMGMPQNRTSLFQGGQGQPQVASDLVAMHKQQFPQYANISGGQMGGGSQPPGMPPPGFSPRTYEESLRNQKLASDIELQKAEAIKKSNPSIGITSELPKPTFGWKYNPDGTISEIKGGPGEMAKTDKVRDDEARLRSQFLSQAKDFTDSSTSYQRIIDSAKNPTAAGDLSLIYNYMKMLDPGSTVREGEFATAQNAGSLPQSIIGQYNKIVSGERFDPTLRKDFVDRASQLYMGQKKRHDERIKEFQRVAIESRLNPSNVIVNVSTPEGGFGGQSEQSQLMWNGRPIKDTPANRAWLQKQQGVKQ